MKWPITALGLLTTAAAASAALAPLPPGPPSNPTTPGKVALGRQLFFDPILSRDRTVSCASCHDPARAFTAPQAVSPGAGGRLGKRNASTLINVGDRKALTWAGASPNLEVQAMIPLQDHAELDMTPELLRGRLQADPAYDAQFRAAFGEAPSVQNLVRALAAFQRTLTSRDSPFDRYRAGDASALNEAQVRGMDLFFDRAECFHCHTGRDFTDGLAHNNAMRVFNPDIGLAERTEQEGDVGRFVTPTLRNVALTGPYLHDGSRATLRDLLETYNDGGEPNPNADPLIRPLGLTDAELDDLEAFLHALTDESVARNPAFRPEQP
ncbi:methylamine utilization protein [Deinococcus seoulensis]|uniref:Methylamine utilization protein n=1 Tax=Deinococcus seoulensis TaxID=1837379 RepID=A0ABQ2RTP5_9DEIO|nr:cytochrome c peroxidase [Deinococcus seoulensis]GGR58721.1 methylamine utilization protein [Deinococcus seoulensis]